MIFIADVHIRPECRKDSERFISWLGEMKKKAGPVYILGDLFDYWFTGIEPCMQPVLTALRSPGIFIVPGNRDFLMTGLKAAGINVLREEEIITTPSGGKALIAHGHTLTLGDRGFKILHALGWPMLRFLDHSFPDSLKSKIARFLVSSSAAIRPPGAVIDPDTAVRRGVDVVICGHLHRRSITERLIVLPSFFDTRQWLTWDDKGMRIEPADSTCS